MQAIRVHAPGPAEVLRWEETPTPEPLAGEVLVRLKASAVNHLDIWMRLGSVYAPMPIVPGCEGAGIVEGLGPGVTGYHKGDEVVVAPWIFPDRPYADPPNLSVRIFGVARDGCYAEYVSAPAHTLLRKPAKLSFEEAASVPLTTTTVYRMAITRGNLQPGESVLVVGATGGIGVAAIQLAHAIGARVFATTRDTRKGNRLYDLGADAVMDSGSDFSAEVRRLTGDRGVDLVLETVGKATWGRSVAALRRGGRIAFCGSTSGAEVHVNLQEIYRKEIAAFGSYGGTPEEIHRVFRLVEEGLIRPVIDSVMPLKDAALAHERMERAEHFGKIILAP
jgi:NADPH:quinone reductase-like Zn-dependent oxidoreductase